MVGVEGGREDERVGTLLRDRGGGGGMYGKARIAAAAHGRCLFLSDVVVRVYVLGTRVNPRL